LSLRSRRFAPLPRRPKKNLRAASLLCALFRVAGWEMVVVGGSAIEFYTAGDYLTRDLSSIGPPAPSRFPPALRRR